jgi:ABC-2 type transport system permease protein
MHSVAAIWRKEFRSFWYSPIAYIVITVFLVIMSWLFFRGFFMVNNADMRSYFGLLPWAFLFLMPALTMRMWAEERRSGTIETLMTKPVSEWQVVLGKYLAAVGFLLAVLLLTIPVALTVYGLSQGSMDWGTLFTSYLGALLMGMAYLAMGSWVGSITANQIVAFILGVALIFLGIIVGEGFVTYFVPPLLAAPLTYLGLGQHFQSIMRGVVDTRDLVYYASVIFLFLYLTARSVESRKWS